jgi:hypothetical protein
MSTRRVFTGRCLVLPLSDLGSVIFTRIATIANGHPGTIVDSSWVSAPIRLVPAGGPGDTPALGATPAEVSADGRTFGVSASASR